MLKGLNRYTITAGDNGFGRKHNAGSNNRALSLGGSRSMVTADVSSGGVNTAGNRSNVAASGAQGFFLKPLMEGIVPESNPDTIRALCRDAYKYDPISGSAVELLAVLPWSNVTLSGVKDQEVLSKYTKSIESMNLMMLMPELTTDFLVNGVFIASGIFDKSLGYFTGISPQAVDSCNVTPMPVYGRDPLVDVRFSAEFQKLLALAKKDPRAAEALKDLGPNFETDLKKGYMSLDPDTTFYVPRRSFATEVHGTPFLQRILPYWVMEKALMRGTIELSYRRQKSILHLLIGEEDWEPTNEEMQNIVNLFLQADSDPTGAIVATRPGIMPSEVRNGSDFWRIDELTQTTNEMKYKGLGFSESLLSGDANLNTMDNALSTFLERLRYMRYVITQRTFYSKMFPHIAQQNNFRAKKGETKQEVQGTYRDQGDLYEVIAHTKPDKLKRMSLFGSGGLVDSRMQRVYSETFDPSEWNMPKLTWIKHLKPEADIAYMDVLEKLESKGIPVPLRVWAAAGGASISDYVYGYDDDIKLRHLLKKTMDRFPKKPQEEADSLFENSASSDAQMLARIIGNKKRRRQLGLALALGEFKKDKPKGLFSRKFDESHLEMRDSLTKKVLSRKGREVVTERIHKVAAQALSNNAARENAPLKEKMGEVGKRLISYSKGTKFPAKKKGANHVRGIT